MMYIVLMNGKYVCYHVWNVWSSWQDVKWETILIIYDCDYKSFERHWQLWLIEHDTKRLNMTQGPWWCCYNVVIMRCKVVFGCQEPHAWSSPGILPPSLPPRGMAGKTRSWPTSVCLWVKCRWPEIIVQRLPGTDVFVKSHWGWEKESFFALGKQPQNLYLTIQQSATEQTLCARLDDARDKTREWDRYSPCPHGAYSSREDLNVCVQNGDKLAWPS